MIEIVEYQPEWREEFLQYGRLNQQYPLLFRDYLRAFPLAASAYGQTKTAIASYHPEEDMEAYYDMKDPVCDIIYCGARHWAEMGGWLLGASDC